VPILLVSTGVASGGRKRSAAFLIWSTSSLCATIIETFAVIPGFNFKSGLLTPMTVSYVTTFCTVIGAFRTWTTFP
jgi:hypothetical protein